MFLVNVFSCTYLYGCFFYLPEATSSKWKIGQATYFSERTRPFWQKWGHFDKIQAIFDKIQAVFDKIQAIFD